MPLAHVAGALGSTAKLLRHRIWRILTVNYGVGMEMVRMTEAELQQGFRAVADRARREPVTIATPDGTTPDVTTPDGRDELVVLSAEEYARLKRRDRCVALTEEPSRGVGRSRAQRQGAGRIRCPRRRAEIARACR